ncbi:hypothetical protein MAR_017317 [Mya arenaria]|uniref:U1-type domain-containing protein n=1 Tax=Mya arenaria TaxID=6604 RepID=A0ABY7EE24_MYAAR|nr:uncharacterized protein LOC128239446 [Mya arenaria]XP_052812040.1 uncharacterized protein LOC128239446 [Mya arenaria]WAR07359.1 hypothetical protein MAR_017317 [Mya arenaria]
MVAQCIGRKEVVTRKEILQRVENDIIRKGKMLEENVILDTELKEKRTKIKIKKCEKNKFICHVCNKTMHSKDYSDRHFNGEKHKKAVNAKDILDSEKASDDVDTVADQGKVRTVKDGQCPETSNCGHVDLLLSDCDRCQLRIISVYDGSVHRKDGNVVTREEILQRVENDIFREAKMLEEMVISDAELQEKRTEMKHKTEEEGKHASGNQDAERG